MTTQAAFDAVVPELLRGEQVRLRRVYGDGALAGPMFAAEIVANAREIGLDTSIIDETLKEIADG